jgi:hypothetical protein
MKHRNGISGLYRVILDIKKVGGISPAHFL